MGILSTPYMLSRHLFSRLVVLTLTPLFSPPSLRVKILLVGLLEMSWKVSPSGDCMAEGRSQVCGGRGQRKENCD